MQKKECELCLAVMDCLDDLTETRIFNERLLESESFVITPCIGPLTMGHVLITSKNHTESLASMNENQITEFDNILNKLLKVGHLYENALLSEHGSFDDQKGGNCIVHTHVHIIPNHGTYYRVLDEFLSGTQISSFVDIHGLNKPYILNCNLKTSEKYLYTAYNVHSQQMRLAICKKTNRLDTNWADNPNENLVVETIKYWQEYGKIST